MTTETTRKRHVQRQRRRNVSWVNWYSSDRWRAERRRYLAMYPYCDRCGEPSAVVDHVIPHKGDEILFWSKANWRPLCKPCHDRHTAKNGGGFGNPEKASQPDGCDENGFPLAKRPHWDAV